MNLINGFLSLFYPTECICCKRYIKDFKYFYICENCFNNIKKESVYKCKICDKPLASEFIDLCVECKERKKTYFDFIKTAGLYKSPLKEIIHFYKFYKKKKLASILGKLILDNIGEKFIKEFDFITYVPLSKKSMKEKNFNHTKLLADFIGKKCKIKVVNAIEKIKETKDQSELTREERIYNLKNAFSLKRKYKKLFFNQKVIIIDDIYTTGSTLNEIAKIIRIGGAIKIVGLVVSRAV